MRPAVSSRTHSSRSSSSSLATRGLGRQDPRLRLLAIVDAVVLEPQHPDDERQGQPLSDERGQDDREREEEDQIAAWEGRAGIGLSGRASAAASESAPRIPAQDRKTAPANSTSVPAIHFGACRTAKTQAKAERDHA